MNKQNEDFGRAALPRRQADRQVSPTESVDASLRVPLLALFGGAAFWLVVSSVLAMIASIKFHAPDFLAACPVLTYGRVQPAADDALLYGFCIPAGLGVMLWLFAQLGQTPLRGAIVPVVAAKLWHLGVLVGLAGILSGNSTGIAWLEFPRAGSVILFFAYLLLALWAMMNFAARRERALYPSHWFLVAALFWFPWIYSTANLFLVAWLVRGVVQAIIGWWFANNLLFIWLALVGIGTAFYFLPKFSGRPLQSHYLALYAFWTLILFGTWCGIPPGVPVPAWLPTISSVAATLTIVPVLAIAVILWQTSRGGSDAPSLECGGDAHVAAPVPADGLVRQDKATRASPPRGFIRFGLMSFVLSSLMLIAMACPRISQVTEFTWFGPAQTQLQLYGFFAMTMFGAIYHLLPRVVGFELPFPKLARLQFWLSMSGVLLFIVPLAIGGVEQGIKLNNPNNIVFMDATKAMLPFLRTSTIGLLFILLGNSLFALNIFAMTFKWELALVKKAMALVRAPLETGSASASLPSSPGFDATRRGDKEVKA
ncbi:MAG: cbb3-type cytochrome c oxidase subunit I [Verrucomicrobiia bacterium]